jgi:two-component system phosphate regulon sensor histidine kinase PhoR
MSMSAGQDEAGSPRPTRAFRRFGVRTRFAAAAAATFASLAAAGALDWRLAALAALGLVAVAATPLRRNGGASRPLQARPRRGAEIRAAALVAALPQPCIVVDRRGVVTMLNARAASAVEGLRVGDPLGFVLRAPVVTEAVDEALADGRPATVEYRETVPLERWFEAHIAPVRLDGEAERAPDHVVVTLEDRTAQQRLERTRVDFVANASHELRTPLASLSGFIETLQGAARHDEAARERFLGIMRQQAFRMSRLIDDLLSLSRIELMQHVRPEGVVDVASVVAQTVDALAPLARENKVEVALDLGRGPIEVRGDRDELFRVFENLVENAIKYGAAGGRVEIAARPAPAADGLPDGAWVSVRDFGPGIPSEHVPRLTERFYRVDTAASREKGGTGLGLAIVKHILARHRGRLAIESRLGEGSSFSVWLPTAQAEIGQGRRHGTVM